VGIQRTVNTTITLPVAEAFQGFGSSLLNACARRPLQHLAFSRQRTAARAEVRQQVPVCPGVYGWLNAEGTLIYVGKSKSLRHRLTSYFAANTTDPKMSKIRRQSRTLVWEPVSHELLALIREQELISRWRPPHNVQGKPERRQPGFICLSRGQAPTLFVAGQVPARAAESFGPIAGRARLSEAIHCLNYVFQLRDCPDRIKMHFSNQLQLFGNDRAAGCLRFELNTCPGPCAGNCSRESYAHKVNKARRFLAGRDTNVLKRLEERMNKAASQLSFERACVLRDQLRQLQWLHRRVQQLSLARRRLDGVWKLPGFDRQEHWIILRGGRIVACTAGPADSRSTVACQTAAERKPGTPRTHLEINLLLLLAAWIRKHPQQLKSLVGFGDLSTSPTTIRRRKSA
jgi:excinuclease ABC subunit C